MQSLGDTVTWIVNTQDQVNLVSGGPDWASRTRSGAMDQALAILDEMIEFRHSFIRFRWWGGDEEPVDRANARMELVDAFHFMLSHSIAKMGVYTTIERVVNAVEEEGAFAILDSQANATPEVIQNDMRMLFKMFLARVLEDHSPFKLLFRLCAYTDMDWSRLSSYYIGKATLNKFRQANGYATEPRTYLKLWRDGKEDNYYLMRAIDEMIDKGQTPSMNQIQAWLEEQYAEVLRNANQKD